MSHLIEENIYLIMAIVNLIPVLLLVLCPMFGKIRSDPFKIFIKSVVIDIVLFFVSLLVVLFIDMSLAMMVVLMIILQLIYFPIVGILLLFLSIGSDVNWAKDNWEKILLPFAILFLWLLGDIICIIQC